MIKILKKNQFLGDLRKNRVLWLFLLPALFYFILHNYCPMVGVYFAFTDFNFRKGMFRSPFVGFKNFEFLLASGTLMELTLRTVLYNIVFILLQNILAVAIAIIIDRVTSKLFKRTVQTMILMPHFVSIVLIGLLSYNLFNYEHGLINGIITGVFGKEPLNFYAEASWWPFIIVVSYLWKTVGYASVTYLAAIAGINKEYYEAAKVDGANIFQQIYHITIPGVKPTFVLLLIYAVGGIVRGSFDLFYQLVGNNGLLFSTTDILDTYVYRATMSDFNYGVGTAVGLYQSLVGFVLVMIVNWLVKKIEPNMAMF